jgi:glycosyltransferase involved in cell wall biosynthesis
MKIAYISNSVIPSRAANSIHVMKVCQAFSDLGHDVTLLAPDKKESYEKSVIDIYKFYGVNKSFKLLRVFWPSHIKGKSYLYGLFAALKSIMLNVDLIFCRHLYGAFFSTLLFKKVIFESHSPIDAGKSVGLDTRMFKRMIANRHFLSLVVITHSLKEYYIENFPQLEGKIIVAPDGADPIDVMTKPFDFTCDKNRLQVGYVGHLYPGRGLDIIISLSKICDWADFNIIGGTEADIDYWKGLSNNINLTFHGFVSPSVAEQMRMACDVLLAPYQNSVSVSGGGGNTVQWMSPLKIFEYMAAGKIIMSSDLPVLHEVLEHNRNAFLCEATNVNDWAEKLNSIRYDRNKMKSLGCNALNDFIGHYSWYSRVQNIMKDINI